MTRKKRKNSESSDRTYKLQVYRFSKVPDGLVKPAPRSGHRTECADTFLYSIGGFQPADHLYHEVWRYDFILNIWEKLEPQNLPSELASCYTVVSGSLLFLQGGTGYPFGQKVNEALYFCNLPKTGNTIAFEELKATTFVAPHPRYGHCMSLRGNYMYVVGGTTGHTYSLDVHSFNLKTREWSKLYDSNNNAGGPEPRYKHEMICYKDRLYIFGGGTQQSAYTLEELPTFNLKTFQWEILKTIGDVEDVEEVFPADRKCHGCVQNPRRPSIVYVNGGFQREEGALNDTWQIDLDTLKWTRIKSLDLPDGVHFHSVAASADGRMFVFGGIERTTNERTNNLYSAWINIPTLADACWEALHYYLREGILPRPENVKSFGLTKKYEDRLVASGILLDSPSDSCKDIE